MTPLLHCLLFIPLAMLAGCDRAPTEGSEDLASQQSAVDSLPNGEVSLAIRAIKDAIADDHLGRAETLLNDLLRREDALPQGRRAELERVAAMIAAEKEIRQPPLAE